MKPRIFFTGLLVILLSIWEPALGASGWQQANAGGFGDLDAVEVSALEVFNGRIYAATSNAVDGTRVFRSQDGMTWEPASEPGFGILHDSKPLAILDLTVFKGRIYASTGRGNAAQIWRAVDGVTWGAPVVPAGFGNENTVDITTLAEYNGYLYAAAWNTVSGVQIWRSFSGDSNTWTQVAPETPHPAATGVTGMAVFNGALYAVVETSGPAQVWRSSDGSAWTTIISNGFGDSLNTATGGMLVYAGYLYVGAGNQTNGAQLWRTNNGTHWNQAITPGFGDPNNQKTDTLFVSRNILYASVRNTVTGMELWSTADGAAWNQVNQDGFGDQNNTGSNECQSTAEFLGDVYIGTGNTTDGGEVWRLPQLRLPLFLPHITR